jgi:hypothetical protein
MKTHSTVVGNLNCPQWATIMIATRKVRVTAVISACTFRKYVMGLTDSPRVDRA